MPNLAAIIHPVVPSWSGYHRCQPFALPHPWRSWLLDSGSLTARLMALRPSQFSVRPLAQYYGYATPTEQTTLNLHANQRVWIREVVLSLGITPVVYARTAIPLATLTGAERQLQHLGSRSLGSYLFSHPHFHRGPLCANHCAPNQLELTWARRSVFYLKHKPLMVSEAFTQQLIDFL